MKRDASHHEARVLTTAYLIQLFCFVEKASSSGATPVCSPKPCQYHHCSSDSGCGSFESDQRWHFQSLEYFKIKVLFEPAFLTGSCTVWCKTFDWRSCPCDANKDCFGVAEDVQYANGYGMTAQLVAVYVMHHETNKYLQLQFIACSGIAKQVCMQGIHLQTHVTMQARCVMFARNTQHTCDKQLLHEFSRTR